MDEKNELPAAQEQPIIIYETEESDDEPVFEEKKRKRKAPSRAHRSKNYCVTINNPSATDEAYVTVLADSDKCTYLVSGKETSDSGTPHLQIYLELKSRTTIAQLKKLLPRAHIEPRHGTAKQASDYCKKDGDYVEYGTISQQGKRTDLVKLKEDILAGSTKQELWSNHFPAMLRYHRGVEQACAALTAPTFETPYSTDDFKNVPPELDWKKAQVFWGEPGSGKTTYAVTLFKSPLLCSHLDDLARFDKNQHDGIIFDDMSFVHLPRETQIHLVDVAWTRSIHIRYRTATIPAGTPRVLTTNLHDGHCLLLTDGAINRRCQVHHLRNLF